MVVLLPPVEYLLLALPILEVVVEVVLMARMVMQVVLTLRHQEDLES
jgi:hypothetical protein